ASPASPAPRPASTRHGSARVTGSDSAGGGPPPRQLSDLSRPPLSSIHAPAAVHLTARAPFLISRRGTPLPTEGQLSGRIVHGHDDASGAAGRAAFLLRPLCQAPRLEPASPHRRRSGTLAPIEDRQGEAQTRHRSHPRSARSAVRLSDRHRSGL